MENVINLENLEKSYKKKYANIVVFKSVSCNEFIVQGNDLLIIKSYFYPKLVSKSIRIDGKFIKTSFIDGVTLKNITEKLFEQQISFLVLNHDKKPINFSRFNDHENQYDKKLAEIRMSEFNNYQVEKNYRAIKESRDQSDENIEKLNDSSRSNDINDFNKSLSILRKIYIKKTSVKDIRTRAFFTPRKVRNGTKKYRY